MSDDVTITVGGAALSGWTDIRITRRIEACPNDFEIGFTERYPGAAGEFVVQAGQDCVLAIGGDTVITGYVDAYVRGYDKGAHTVAISGRGRTQDLVDCGAEWPTGQISGSNALQIAQKLAQPYKGPITVSLLGDAGPAIPQFNLTIGETAYDIIERICRYSGLLAYEDTAGNLVLATTQTTKAASGFTEGVNVQSAHIVNNVSQRFSDYKCFLLSMDVLGDLGDGGNYFGEAKDPNVARHRVQFLIAEAGGGGKDICLRRARWEAARRSGRGFSAQIVCDSWRDSAGTLWTPNTQAQISLPALKLDGVTWTIGEVTYRRGLDGSTAEITLMDPSAFQPEPILLQPQFLDVPPAPAS